jgi:hypothetical protein
VTRGTDLARVILWATVASIRRDGAGGQLGERLNGIQEVDGLPGVPACGERV